MNRGEVVGLKWISPKTSILNDQRIYESRASRNSEEWQSLIVEDAKLKVLRRLFLRAMNRVFTKSDKDLVVRG